MMSKNNLNMRQVIYAICARDTETNQLWCVGHRESHEREVNPPNLSSENVIYWCGSRTKNPFLINHYNALYQATDYMRAINKRIHNHNPNIELFIVNLQSKKCPVSVDMTLLETMNFKNNKTKYKLK